MTKRVDALIAMQRSRRAARDAGASSDDAFMQWCKANKACKYCRSLFVGPVCLCARKRS